MQAHQLLGRRLTRRADNDTKLGDSDWHIRLGPQRVAFCCCRGNDLIYDCSDRLLERPRGFSLKRAATLVIKTQRFCVRVLPTAYDDLHAPRAPVGVWQRMSVSCCPACVPPACANNNQSVDCQRALRWRCLTRAEALLPTVRQWSRGGAALATAIPAH